MLQALAPTTATAQVYVLIGLEGRPLYIGQSADADRRWITHVSASPWAMYVVERHNGPQLPLAEALVQERSWIEEFRPMFNVVANPDYRERGQSARRELYAARLEAQRCIVAAAVDDYRAAWLGVSLDRLLVNAGTAA